MAIQRVPPPQPPKKAAWGCLGCGCLVVILIFLLLVGLVGGGVYFCYKGLYATSSPAPAAITAFAGSDDVFNGAEKKIEAFNEDVSASKTSTLTLSADEVNSLIAHNPNLKKLQATVLVTFDGDQARLRGTIPSNSIPIVNAGVKDRYFNLDLTTSMSFNTDTKNLEFELHKAQLGDFSAPENSLASLQASLSQNLNPQLRQNTAIWNVLQVAKTVTIRNGQFVVETK